MRPIKEFQQQLYERINPLVGFSVARYVFSIGIFIAVVVFGYIATQTLGVDLLPATNIPVVSVSLQYPGATPTVVDQQITQVLEGAVSSLPGISTLNSTSNLGSARLFLQFTPDTNQSDAANKVASAVAGAVRRLPTGVNPPTVSTFDSNSQPILEFGLSGGGHNLAEVQDYAQNILAPQLERVSGVANVAISGGPTRQFQVLLQPSRLQLYNLNPQQVSTAITNAALDQPIGTITRDNQTLTFATRNTPTNLDQVAQILVDPTKGVRVSDLGTVRDSSVASSYVRVNGNPVVLVGVQQTATSNAVAVADGVQALLKQIALPSGYSLTISTDTTTPIRASIASTYRELLITALVVTLILLLFLGRLNTAFTVILAIPISLSAAPSLYQLLGFTFNQVSLLALIVAIGIVVDDSIVVAENVERYRAMGLDRMQAVLRGASEVFGAVMAASLSLLSVLIPVSFIGGFFGRYLQQFSLGLAAAVALSLLEALLFLTVRMAYTPDSHPRTWPDFLKSFAQFGSAIRWGLLSFRKTWGIILGLVVALLLWRVNHFALIGVVLYPLILGVVYYLLGILLSFLEALTSTLHGLTERVVIAARDAYVGSLDTTLRRSGWVLIGALIFFVATVVFVAPRLSLNFVPQSDSGNITVNLRMPPGTSITLTNQLAGRLEGFLSNRPEIRTIQTEISPTSASVSLQLLPRAKRPSAFALIPRYQAITRSMFQDQPSARVSVSAGGGFRGQGSGLQVNLVSFNYDLLNTRVTQAVSFLDSNPNVLSADAGAAQTSLESAFIPDPNRLSGTGLTTQTIASALQTYASGTQAGNVLVGGVNYPIQVQLDPQYLSDAQALLSLPIYSTALGAPITIGQLGTIMQRQAPVSISRINRLYTQSLSINLGPNAPTALTFQNQLVKDLTKAGILDGQVSLTTSGFSQTALAAQLATLGPEVFGLALMLVYLVMGAQFNSFRYPFYLLLPVPLAITGALWFIWLRGGVLDIFSIMGFLLLIGLSAKNAIIYLEFVVERLGTMPLKDALIEAAGLRFRPIIMTTLTVLAISFPLMFGSGEGSEFGNGLGVIMLGGILISAFLTFFVVPAAFYQFERTRPSSQPKVQPVAVPVMGD